METDRIVRDPECQSMTGLARSSRWRLERAGRFPPRVQLSDNSIGWRLSELQQWIRKRSRAGPASTESNQPTG